MELTFRHDVGAAGRNNILGQDDLGNAGHLFCFRDIDVFDDTMVADFGLNHDHVPAIPGHLQFLVIAVISHAADFG